MKMIGRTLPDQYQAILSCIEACADIGEIALVFPDIKERILKFLRPSFVVPDYPREWDYTAEIDFKQVKELDASLKPHYDSGLIREPLLDMPLGDDVFAVTYDEDYHVQKVDIAQTSLITWLPELMLPPPYQVFEVDEYYDTASPWLWEYIALYEKFTDKFLEQRHRPYARIGGYAKYIQSGYQSEHVAQFGRDIRDAGRLYVKLRDGVILTDIQMC